tara:strand:+ start:3607 stop:5967 length:2361 start_codon:yes stop_codon:yes gene_type:complete
MKISKNWLNEYLSSNKTNEQLVDLFTQLGLECTFYHKKVNLENIVVGKVLACIKHPNADRLKVCSVDVGNEVLEIICGAPNIDKNLIVAVAKVGSEFGDFKIKKTKIRNIFSNGMICSGKELGLSEDHDGIMILDNNMILGTAISDALKLKDDIVFDFDITPNRGDCFSHLGIARELAIIENKKIQFEKIIIKTSDYSIHDLVKVDIKDDNICDRYACRIVKNIKVEESPQWLKNKLLSIDQKPINNIVDIANYIMFDLGQPIHVFDYDKVDGKKININLANKTDKINCLDNNLRNLDKNDIVISDSKKPIAIAGVIGGLNSHVDANTKNIIIESAVFNEVNIRKSSKKHNYSKEASKRFERGVDVENIVNVLDKFIFLLLQVSGGEVSKDYIDIYKKSKNLDKIVFDLDKCNKFLGFNLSKNEADEIFNSLNVNFANKENIYKCVIPSYRNDIKLEIDLFEEVARLYGYDNIPSSTHFSFSVKSFVKDEESLDNKIRFILSNNGFNEHYSNSLYSKDDTLVDTDFKPIKLLNPLSQDMEYLRNSLIPGLLRALSFNEKREHNIVKLFELGSISSFNQNNFNKSNQYKNLILSWMGKEVKHWKYSTSQNIYTIKGEIEHLFKMLNIKDFRFSLSNKNNLYICCDNKVIGYLKEVDNDIRNQYNIKSDIYIAVIKIDDLNKLYSEDSVDYRKVNSFPSISRDISLLIDKKYSNEEIENVIYNHGGDKLSNALLFDIYDDEKISSELISMAYSLIFKSNERTLTDNEVDRYINKIVKNLKNKFDIIQR